MNEQEAKDLLNELIAWGDTIPCPPHLRLQAHLGQLRESQEYVVGVEFPGVDPFVIANHDDALVFKQTVEPWVQEQLAKAGMSEADVPRGLFRSHGDPSHN